MYSAAFISQWKKFKHCGMTLIQDWLSTRTFGQLQQKGVDRQDISRILEGSAQDDLAAARNLLKKRLRTADLSDLKEKNRLGAYLGRRGFSYDVIRRVMQEVQSGQEE